MTIKPSATTYGEITSITVYKDTYNKLLTIGTSGIVMNDISYFASEMKLNNSGLHVYPKYNQGGGSIKVGDGGLQTFYNNAVQFTAVGNKIGFFGTAAVAKVTGITTSSTLSTLISALKKYGLV